MKFIVVIILSLTTSILHSQVPSFKTNVTSNDSFEVISPVEFLFRFKSSGEFLLSYSETFYDEYRVDSMRIVVFEGDSCRLIKFSHSDTRSHIPMVSYSDTVVTRKSAVHLLSNLSSLGFWTLEYKHLEGQPRTNVNEAGKPKTLRFDLITDSSYRKIVLNRPDASVNQDSINSFYTARNYFMKFWKQVFKKD